MKVLNPQRIKVIERQIDTLIKAIHDKEQDFAQVLSMIHPRNLRSARNLIHYLALRAFDLRSLQAQLSEVSLSSFAHAEGYILHNLYQIKQVLASLACKDNILIDWGNAPYTFSQSKEQLRNNALALFGRPEGDEHRTRVMVTMAGIAADEYAMVRRFLEAGMNVARINTGHDSPEVWQKIILNIRRAEQETGKRCKVYIDLAGPKVRTDLKDVILLNKDRWDTKKGGIRLFKGDELLLVRKAKKIKKTKRFKDRFVAIFQSTLPQILEDVEVGHHIYFDDGKIGARVMEKNKWGVILRIYQAAEKGTKLKDEKGINVPDTHLNIPSLTESDLQNLEFVANYADIVGYSFVRQAEDVEALQTALRDLGRPDMHIVLKIENREAFENLPNLILTAMRFPLAGVMIARGDLAVEIGFERTAEVQEEIMWICEAAHLPDIWATQVLEQLAKKGLATRSEITDAAMASRAECVMLNKGPYITDAIRTLTDILIRMETHMDRKQGSFRPLSVAQRFFDTGPVSPAYLARPEELIPG